MPWTPTTVIHAILTPIHAILTPIHAISTPIHATLTLIHAISTLIHATLTLIHAVAVTIDKAGFIRNISCSWSPLIRPWFLAANSTGKAGWGSGVYVFTQSASLGISATMPILGPNNEVKGVLCADVELAQISTALGQMVQVSGNVGNAAIFERNSNGYLIGAAAGGLSYANGDRRNLRGSGDDLLRRGGDILVNEYGPYETTPSVMRPHSGKWEQGPELWWSLKPPPMISTVIFEDGFGIDWVLLSVFQVTE